MSLIKDVKNNDIESIKTAISVKTKDKSMIEAAVSSIKNCRFECFELINDYIQESTFFDKKDYTLKILEISARENKFDIFKSFFFQYKDFLNEEDYKKFIFSSLRHHRIFKTIVQNKKFEESFFYELLIYLHTVSDRTLQSREAVLNKNVNLIIESFNYTEENYYFFIKDNYSFSKFFDKLKRNNTTCTNKRVFVSFILEKNNSFFIDNIYTFQKYLEEKDFKYISQYLTKEKIETF